MEPKKVGRTLGIGVRVASNMLRERVERAAAAHPPPRPARKWAAGRGGARSPDSQPGGHREAGRQSLWTGFPGPIYACRQRVVAGDHRSVFRLIRALFCPKRLSIARHLEAGAGTYPLVALLRLGRSLRLVLGELVSSRLSQEQAGPRVAKIDRKGSPPGRGPGQLRPRTRSRPSG